MELTIKWRGLTLPFQLMSVRDALKRPTKSGDRVVVIHNGHLSVVTVTGVDPVAGTVGTSLGPYKNFVRLND